VREPLGSFSFARMIEAVERVKRRLLRAVRALEAAGIPHAVAGGHAVAARVARIDEGGVRNTPDVEILIRRADFEAASAALTSYRIKDQVYLLDMIDVGLIDQPTVATVPPELAPRLQELIDNPDS
jgi:hypothetical protein